MFLDYLLFLTGLFVLIFVCIFLYFGGTIFELITNSDFNYIHSKIKEDIKKILQEENNNDFKYQISVLPGFIYLTDNDVIDYDSLNNNIIVSVQDKSKKILNIQDDLSKIVPIFSRLKTKFDFEKYSI